MTPEDVLAELNTIRTKLDSRPAAAPERAALESRREELRLAALEVADATRNPETLAAELEHLERRLAGFDNERINVPAWQIAMTSGGKLTINDPAAYAAKLNEALDEASATDRARIEERINQLKRTFGK
jgi:hypothetical protein